MSTASIVSEIKLKAPNWSRDGSDTAILNFIQRAQLYLFSKPSQVSLNIDESTGDYPYLVTTAGVRKYDIPDITREFTIDDVTQDVPLRIARVDSVYSDVSSASDYGSCGTLGTVSSPVKSFSSSQTRYRFSTVPATEGAPTRIIFPFDPGDSTTKYKIVSLIEPLPLTADTIPIMIPQDWEYILVEGALGWIEYNDVGRSERLDKFKREYAREFWYRFNMPTATIDFGSKSNRRF